ncbi:hypothetical protein ACWELJ_31445, partial [Nocardia sp. NPDC004582]
MGDDRYGRTPRPGGRAPWERYSADGDDPSRAGRRSRHTDDADSAAGPISVQDLVERVDSERKTRRRPRTDAGEQNPPAATNGTAAGEPAAPVPATPLDGASAGGAQPVVPPQPSGTQPAPGTGSQRTVRDDSHLRRVAAAPGTGSNRTVRRADPTADLVTDELPPVTEAVPAAPTAAGRA